MLDLNTLRQAFGQHLVDHAATCYSLDAALMHVAELAYRQGYADAQSTPPNDGGRQP